MKKYYVMFKWRDFADNENFETKEFSSLHKANNFATKLKKDNRKLIKKYGIDGIYNPFYDIEIIESESK